MRNRANPDSDGQRTTFRLIGQMQVQHLYDLQTLIVESRPTIGARCGGAHVVRMGIRIRAFESCCTSAADRLDSPSFSVVLTKRDVVQSGQMVQCPDLAAHFERWDKSVNMFEVETPRAISFR
jgi:hypothetical protein